MYHQYQQQQQVNNNNYNQRYYENPPNNPNNNNNNNRNFLNADNINNNNYGNSSSSSDSDSESESDEEMEENIDAIPNDEENLNGLPGVGVRALLDDNVNALFENARVEKVDENDRLIQRINNFIEEEDNAVMNDLSIDDPSNQEQPQVANDEIFKFNLPALRDNDDSSRESMDEDAIRDEHELLENIANLNQVKDENMVVDLDDVKKLEDFDDEFLPDQKEILKIDNLNYLEQLKDVDNENEEVNNIVNENPQNNPEENSNEEQLNQAAEAEAEAEAEGDDQKNKLKKNRRDLFYDQQLKPNKKLKLNNGNSVNKNSNNTNKTPRTIFHKALDAVNMTWDNDHLKNILASDAYSLSSDNSVQIAGSSKSIASNATSAKSNFNSTGQPLWHEPMAMCAARIDSLRSHGHIDAALRLSVSVVRTMKQLQRDAQNLWHKYKPIPTQPPPKYVASASINDCNNSKCKDCQLNKLFEFTIHKSSYTPAQTKALMPNITENAPVGDCHKCVESDAVKNAVETEEVIAEKPQPVAPVNQPSNNYPQFSPKPSSSVKYDMPPPPLPSLSQQQHQKQKLCMCHYQPQHSGHPMQNYPGKISSSSGSSSSNCQIPCHYPMVPSASGSRHIPQPPPNHNHNPNAPQPLPQNSQHHRMNMPGSSSSSSSSSSSAGSSGSSAMYPHGSNSSSNKYYDCSKNISCHASAVAPPPPPPPQHLPNMSMCQLHQKRPCIKSMCCSIVPPPEKHHPAPSTSHHYCTRPHCGSSSSSLGPSKYDYMSKYPVHHHNLPPSHPASSTFCSGCMRSNCLLKSNAHMAPSMPSISTVQAPPAPAPQQPAPASNLCKNCKSTDSKAVVPAFRPTPPAMISAPQPSTSEHAKYNIVNYGASTSKGGSSSGSSSSSSSSSALVPSTSSASTSSTSQDFNKFSKKNPSCVSKCLDCAVGCEIDFPLDAVACIFDCLTEACITSTDVATLGLNGRLNGISPAVEDSNIIAPKYKHIQVPGSKDATETFLSLAFEAAILALGKQRIMPQGLYSQHLICKQQDQLIARLRNVDLDQLLVEIIKNLSIQMMDGGPTSGFGESIHPESVPMHTLARFLFASLLNQYPDLAFKIGLRAMRFPILENVRSDPSEGSSSSSAANANYVNSPYPRWWTLGHLESQQCSLSSTMLSASKGDKIRLASVLENARHNIHSSTHLFKLAQDAFRFATPENGPRSQTLLGVAFELGLQVMRMTLTCLNWRRREMVRWLVTCATQLGLDATISIMQNWYELFTPTEATGPVATTIMSHSTILRLNLSIKVTSINKFPKCLLNINKIIITATRRLIILCSHFSTPVCHKRSTKLCFKCINTV